MNYLRGCFPCGSKELEETMQYSQKKTKVFDVVLVKI